MNAILKRETFTTSRMLDFFSARELVAQIGHAQYDWPVVAVKELVDNAIDAAEDADIAPRVEVEVQGNAIRVIDNGPGIPDGTIDRMLDYSVRVSSREAYISPTRGAQGNALKTLVAMPFVLDGERGVLEVEAQGVLHRITCQVDRIRQRPAIRHERLASLVKEGTTVTVHWPDSARSILDNARSRFLQVARAFAFLNPHLDLSVAWDTDREHWPATDTAWEKWKPSNPTSPHWYKPEHLERLIAAYITHDEGTGRVRTVRELVAEFRGLSATAKQKVVLEAVGLSRQPLNVFVKGDVLDGEQVGKLLAAMQAQSAPVKSRLLGSIGEDHVRARFTALGAEMETFRYKRITSDKDGLPEVAETAFAWCPERKARTFITGVNWSSGIQNPFRELGRQGFGMESILAQQHSGAHEPVVFLLHLACPRVAYADRGKSSIVMEE